jgi:hypothetical protein
LWVVLLRVGVMVMVAPMLGKAGGRVIYLGSFLEALGEFF